MNANVIEKINATNQKYLKNLLGKQIPAENRGKSEKR